MNRMKILHQWGVWQVLGALVLGLAGTAVAESLPTGMAQSDVIILGEVHDNPAHHQTQAQLVADLAPRAVIWEMLTPEQAEALTPAQLGNPAELERTLEWEASGWPDFSLYAPIFAASQGAQHFGGQVPRAHATDVMQNGAAAFFGETSADYGLVAPLAPTEQATREADQLANHCNAMPAEMLPLLVEFQRLRDAVLARAVVKAFEQTGGPVAVITGNGHARTDRGIPIYLNRVRPDMRVFSLGQSEAGQISGSFDALIDAPGVDRPDPCLAFQGD